MIFLKLSFLNLLKHPKRTILILFAVLVSVLVMQFVSGMLEGMRNNFFEHLLQEGGHAQLHREGWEDRLNPYSLDYLIEDPDEILKKLKQHGEVTAAEKMIHFGALLTSGEKDLHIEGVGVEANTSFFSRIRQSIIEGEWLPDGKGAAISNEIADLLDVSYGEGLIVLVEDSAGSPYYIQYPVTAVFDTGSKEIDERAFYMSHSNAEELLYVENSTTELRITITDHNRIEQFLEDIAPLLESNNIEARTWKEIHGSMIVFIRLFDVIMVIINVLIIIVSATVITNAILMNVFERLGEFGTMRAIGLKKRQLFSLIMSEGFIQGAAGSLLGIAVGVPIVLYFQIHGLDMGEVSEFMTSSSVYYFHFSLKSALINTGSGILIALAGSLYAALTALRMKLITALNSK